MQFRLIKSGDFVTGIQPVIVNEEKTHFLSLTDSLPQQVTDSDEIIDSFDLANKRYQEDLKKRIGQTKGDED